MPLKALNGLVRTIASHRSMSSDMKPTITAPPNTPAYKPFRWPAKPGNPTTTGASPSSVSPLLPSHASKLTKFQGPVFSTDSLEDPFINRTDYAGNPIGSTQFKPRCPPGGCYIRAALASYGSPKKSKVTERKDGGLGDSSAVDLDNIEMMMRQRAEEQKRRIPFHAWALAKKCNVELTEEFIERHRWGGMYDDLKYEFEEQTLEDVAKREEFLNALGLVVF